LKMMSSKNNGFTASDIERYHAGKMLPEERHALEKAALDDPFLADALEGYAFTSTPSADLAKIQSRLDEKRSRKNLVPIFQKYKWLSVAAIFLIIAGTGWFVYTISLKEKNSIATFQNKTPVEDSMKNEASEKNISPDTILHLTVPAQQTVEQKQKTTNGNTNGSNTGTYAFTPKEELNKSNDKQIQIPVDSITQKTFAASQNETALNNNGLLDTQRGDLDKNNAKSTDPRANNISQGYYKDVASNAPVKAKARRVADNDTIKDLNIVLQPLPKDSLQSLEEVVVVGYGTEKKSIEKYPKITIDTLEPAEGYVKFDDYVINNLKMPEELKTKTISGEVQLSFDVDKDGQPVNITVVKSLCEKCDEEAIRLLKEGPKWKKKKNKKGKITIKF